ncbi:MAG: UDP-3-O-acyl-N-acetylglucosamine deacetylase [Synergistaceae bacterium]|nr:UDP-3-O-acyl-N-acetylglucosamine deacetylase [Synergistaceae bacterium]
MNDGKIILEGCGLHSGKNCRLVIERCDSPEILIRSGNNELPLRMLKTSGTNRGSDYAFPDGTTIRTCEHVLSALYGLGMLSGLSLNVEGGEIPALDGCSRILCGELDALGHVGNEPPALEVHEPVMVCGNDRTRFVAAFPSDGLHVTYTVEYEHVGAQVYDYTHSPENYRENISGARTFAMKSDIEYLRAHGMALGGSLDNAIVIGDTIEAKGGLRWPDEFVRHKVLDLLGDIASLGRPLNAHIIAVRAGHELHLRLAEKLKGE